MLTKGSSSKNVCSTARENKIKKIIFTSSVAVYGFARVPYFIGYVVGKMFDMASLATGKKFAISGIRVKKFCSTTQFSTSIFDKTEFTPPYSIHEGLKKTIEYEFLRNDEEKDREQLFYSE